MCYYGPLSMNVYFLLCVRHAPLCIMSTQCHVCAMRHFVLMSTYCYVCAHHGPLCINEYSVPCVHTMGHFVVLSAQRYVCTPCAYTQTVNVCPAHTTPYLLLCTHRECVIRSFRTLIRLNTCLILKIRIIRWYL